MKDLAIRCVVGSISLGLIIVCVVLAQFLWFRPVFGLALAGVAILALWEYYNLARIKQMRPAFGWGIGCAVFYLFVCYLRSQFLLPPAAPFAALAIVVFLLFGFYLFRRQDAIRDLALSVFGILYIVVPLSLFLDLLYTYPNSLGTEGWWWFFLAVIVSVATDAGGYFVGSPLGKHPLWPAISPKKSWEGAVGGFICGTAAAMGWYLFGINQATFWQVTLVGAIMAIIGQFGDLAESLLKRDAGVKDSNQIPALGGMLDVVDSILFNLPIVYLFLRLTYGEAP